MQYGENSVIYIWTCIPESYIAPAVQFCGMLLADTSHMSSLSSLSPLNNILMERGPLGGDPTAHVAPWLRSSSLHVKFIVYMQSLKYKINCICIAWSQNSIVNILLLIYWEGEADKRDECSTSHSWTAVMSLSPPWYQIWKAR